jgi:hypothetical protein
VKKINRKIFVTTGLLFLIMPLIFLFIIYNQKKEAKAQEEQVILVCDGDEIPIGEAIDETLAVGHDIINESQKMIDSSSDEIAAANQLLNLVDRCSATGCSSGCDYADTNNDGIDDQCAVRGCSGTACPEVKNDAQDVLTQIGNIYLQIENSKNAIDSDIGERGEILDKLEKSREELPKCVTPAGELTEAEAKEAQTLYTCKEALYERALPSGKTDCDNPKNFICCYYK